MFGAVLRQQIIDILIPYHDSPQVWINQNEPRIVYFAERWGSSLFLDVLKVCVTEGGKLQYFFADFTRWKVAAARKQAEKKAASNADDQAYFSKTGLSGSLARPLDQVTLTEKEQEEIEQHLQELKKKFPYRVGG